MYLDAVSLLLLQNDDIQGAQISTATWQKVNTDVWERGQCYKQMQTVLCSATGLLHLAAAVGAQTWQVLNQAPYWSTNVLLARTLHFTCKHDLVAVLWAELEGRQRTSQAQALGDIESCQVPTDACSLVSHGWMLSSGWQGCMLFQFGLRAAPSRELL